MGWIYKISESIKYFHGSYDLLPIGTILTPEKGTFNPEDMLSDNMLELFRPNQYISRNNAVFMTDNPDDIDSAGGPIDHVYIVRPLSRVEKHDLNWMSEIDSIISELSNEESLEDEETIQKIEKAALNYWDGTPHYNEALWEYLATSALVIKEI